MVWSVDHGGLRVTADAKTLTARVIIGLARVVGSSTETVKCVLTPRPFMSFLGRIFGLIPAPEVVQTRDTQGFPWLYRFESHGHVW